MGNKLKYVELGSEEILLSNHPIRNDYLRLYWKVIKNDQGHLLDSPVVCEIDGSLDKGALSEEHEKINRVRDSGGLKSHIEFPDFNKVKYYLLSGLNEASAYTLQHKRIPCLLVNKNSKASELDRLVQKGDRISSFPERTNNPYCSRYSITKTIEDGFKGGGDNFEYQYIVIPGKLSLTSKINDLIERGDIVKSLPGSHLGIAAMKQKLGGARWLLPDYIKEYYLSGENEGVVSC